METRLYEIISYFARFYYRMPEGMSGCVGILRSDHGLTGSCAL